jgi:hypothetical protein
MNDIQTCCLSCLLIQLCSPHNMSKCKIIYQRSILTPTRQSSSNPWGLQINFSTLFISPHQLLAVINTAMGGHELELTRCITRIIYPRGPPPLPVTPELPTRNHHNGDLVQYSILTKKKRIIRLCLNLLL